MSRGRGRLLVCVSVVAIATAGAAQARTTAGSTRPSSPQVSITTPWHVTCGGRYHQITDGSIGGVLILRQRNIGCATIATLGHHLLHGVRGLNSHAGARIDRFVCHYVPIKAGGGAARCTSARAMVLFGFE
jgi:hypothetical protein